MEAAWKIVTIFSTENSKDTNNIFEHEKKIQVLQDSTLEVKNSCFRGTVNIGRSNILGIIELHSRQINNNCISDFGRGIEIVLGIVICMCI